MTGLVEEVETVDKAGSDDDYSDFERRGHRIRMVAWITIVALIVGGGGASLATLFFG